MNAPAYNFCSRTWMESCLCGVLWYLAEEKSALHERVAQINQDLVNNAEAAAQIKQLQKEVGGRIARVDQAAEAYYTAMQEILERIDELQQIWGTEERVNCHAVMADRLLELLAAEGAFFKHYRKSNSNDHIRALQAMCQQAGADASVAQLLVNDYFSKPQAEKDYAHFAGWQTGSSLLLKKKLSMYKALKLTPQQCEDIIERVDLPLSPLEHRLLGEAQYSRGCLAQAKDHLERALVGGDLEAGDFLYRNMKDGEMLLFLAVNGVAQAAYELGENQYKEGSGYPSAMQTAMKYLNIAAAREHPKALELLGDIWYEKALAGGSKREDALKTALQYYLASKAHKTLKKTTLERIGLIYYELSHYANAKSYLEQAGTPQANFLLGQMYEKGLGLAADQNEALEHYEAAADGGHAQAQVEYSRLSAKIEAEEKKAYISSNTSYYSGW